MDSNTKTFYFKTIIKKLLFILRKLKMFKTN